MALPLFSPGDDPGPSFAAVLRRADPLALPAQLASGAPAASSDVAVRHGTTVVALRFVDGVVMAGDRRATEGNFIAHRSMEKVFPADRHSAVAIAGAAGPAVQMVKLFQTQLEHYEKVEGIALSLEGKANQLGQMVREHLPMAYQGLVVVPLFAGYDLDAGVGRIFSYDVTGGRYEEHRFHSIGSGSVFARGSLKKLYAPRMSTADAVLACMQALYDAADDDSATGGPDVTRRIYPVVATVTADGYQRLTDDEAGAYAQAVISGRMSAPDGPTSPLRAAIGPGD